MVWEDVQLILRSMRSDTGGAAAMGQFQPCQPSKVLFTAFVTRKSLENDGGKKGDLPPSGGKQSHACDGGQGWAGSAAHQASVHVGSSVSGLGNQGGVVPCPLLLNP